MTFAPPKVPVCLVVLRHITGYLIKVYFSCQNTIFVTAISLQNPDADPDLDPHVSALVWLPGDPELH